MRTVLWALGWCGWLLLATKAAADTTDPSVVVRDQVAIRSNRPPKLERMLVVQPTMLSVGGAQDALLRSGRLTRIQLTAVDPDADRLLYRVDPVPEGASFDHEAGVLTWQPTLEQLGRHELVFEVSDGELSDKRTFALVVMRNRPPAACGDSDILIVANPEGRPASQAMAYEPSSNMQLACDAESDDLTVQSQQLPRGAELSASHGSISLVWRPTPADVGEHDLVVRVSDGEFEVTITKKVVVFPAWAGSDYHRWLLLGAGPSAYATPGDGEWFVGGAFDVTFAAVRERATRGYACAHDRREGDCHASHHRFYGEFEVLAATRSEGPGLFSWGAGYSASLEWAPMRRYLIPHYGIEVGGVVRDELGHLAQTRPYLGLHLIAGDDIWVNATFGYRVVPARLSELTGPTAGLKVILNPW